MAVFYRYCTVRVTILLCEHQSNSMKFTRIFVVRQKYGRIFRDHENYDQPPNPSHLTHEAWSTLFKTTDPWGLPPSPLKKRELVMVWSSAKSVKFWCLQKHQYLLIYLFGVIDSGWCRKRYESKCWDSAKWNQLSILLACLISYILIRRPRQILFAIDCKKLRFTNKGRLKKRFIRN